MATKAQADARSGLSPALLLQTISDAEGEITKRQVQISSAGKQAEKLSKECCKTQKELDKATADLEAKQKEQEVGERQCTSSTSYQNSSVGFIKEGAVSNLTPVELTRTVGPSMVTRTVLFRCICKRKLQST